MGSAVGAAKVAAHRIGIDVAEYEARVAAGLKWCSRCKEWHLREAFGIDRSRGDGLAAACRDSLEAGGRRPGQRMRRTQAADGKAWCRECASWLPVADIAQGVCREHRNTAARAWYADQSDEWRRRKMAIQRGLDPVPEWWRAECFDVFNSLCAYGCGRAAQVLDHIWPVSHGGRSTPGNLTPVCTPCNSSKNARNPVRWIEKGFAAFPEQWLNILILAIEHGSAEWIEVA